MITKNFKFLIIIFLTTAVFGSNSYAMEAQTEEEERQEEANKKRELEQKELSPVEYNPKNLMTQASAAFVSSFLDTLNEAEREELRATYNGVFPSSMISEFLDEEKEKEQTLLSQYENLPPEVKEIITQIIDAPVTRTGETLLHQAQTPSEAEKLLFLGANIRTPTKLEQGTFTTALARGNIKVARKILEVLKEKGHKIFLDFDIMGFSELEYAIVADVPDFVIMMLENPENAFFYPDHLNHLRGIYPGFTSLMLAALNSSQSIKPLLAKGANVSIEDLIGRNAFLLASRSQSTDILKAFAQHDPEIAKKVDQNGNNALFYASHGNNSQVIRYLIKDLNLDPNHINNDQATPLTVLLFELSKKPQYQNVIFELLKYGANPNTQTTNLNIALSYNYYDTEFIKQYINAGAQVNYLEEQYEHVPQAIKFNYFYPLATAIFNVSPQKTYGPIRENLNYDIIGFLIDQGAKITQEHKDQIRHSGNSVSLLIEDVPVFTQEELERL